MLFNLFSTHVERNVVSLNEQFNHVSPSVEYSLIFTHSPSSHFF
jgi:hypothetical protein